MKRLKIAIILTLALLAFVFPSFSASAEDAVTLTASQITAEENDGYVLVAAKLTNNSASAIFGKKATAQITAADDGAPVLIETDILGIERLAAGEGADVIFKFSLSDSSDLDGEDSTDVKESGCKSSAGVLAVIIACVAVLALIVLGKGNLKKTGIFMLAVLMCGSVFCAPAFSEETADTAPVVTIKNAVILGDSDLYRELGFFAEITDANKKELKTETQLDTGKKQYGVSISVEYSDTEITGMGMLSVPVSIVSTLPIAIQKGKEVNLTETYGTEISLYEVNGSESFTCVYPDRIYTSDYSAKFDTIAYVRYSQGGKEGIAYSEVFETSLKMAARAIVGDESTSEEVKNEIQKNVLDRADKKAALTEEEDTALRMKILEKMVEMGSVEWKPKKTVQTDGQLVYSTPVYIANKPYKGLIYNQQGYGTAEGFSYLVGGDGYLDASMTASINALWKTCPGVSCSTSITGAYAYFCFGLTGQVGSLNMNPAKSGYGFSKVGSYKVPAGSVTTEEIIKANDVQTIYKAYAELKVADILDANWYNASNNLLGHVVMVRENPTVVYNADGTIDPDKSTIKTIEQCSTVSTVDGFLTTWPQKTLTFRDCISGKNLKYIPIKYTNLVADYTELCYCFASGLNVGSMLKEGLKGTVESNFICRWISAEVVDASGNTVFEYKQTPSTGYLKAVLLSSMTGINDGLKKLPAGTYTVKVSACYKDAERLLYEGTETK